MKNKESGILFQLCGIKNCDTIRKARSYLDEHAILFHFHDYRTDGLDETFLQNVIDKLGYEALLNTRSATWRKLSEERRHSISNAEAAKKIMQEQPAVIKRPLLIAPNNAMLLGFSDTTYQQFIQENT